MTDTDKQSVKVIELLEINGKHVSKEGGKRQYHHKSKNGCDTCKRRRVKCTEEKPICSKCLKMNHECLYSKALPRRRRTKKEIELSKKLEAGLIKEEDIETEINDNQYSSRPNRLKVEDQGDLLTSNNSDSQNFSDSSNIGKAPGGKFDNINNSKNSSNSSTSSNTKSKVQYVLKREDGSVVTLNSDPTELPKGIESSNRPKIKRAISSSSKYSSMISGNASSQNSLPQLMSLTSSEKYANIISASSNESVSNASNKTNSQSNMNFNFQMNGNNSKNGANGLSSPQSNPMSMNNSIGTFFSLNNAKLLSNLTKVSKSQGTTVQTPGGPEQNQKNDIMFQSPQIPKDGKQVSSPSTPNFNMASLLAGMNPKTAMMALANLPKLASAFGGNKDDMGQSAMNFISMLSQGNKAGTPNGLNIPKEMQSKIDSMLNNPETPNPLASLSSLGISLGQNNGDFSNLMDSLQEKSKNSNKGRDESKGSSSQDDSSRSNSSGNKESKKDNGKNEESKMSKQNEYNNIFNTFYNNNKMSMPSTPNMFQPAGIGGITYDFNELINNQMSNVDAGNKDNLLADGMDKMKSPNSEMNPHNLMFNTPEILKSPLLTPSSAQHKEDGNSKDAFSRVHKDLKHEALEVLSTMATVAQRDKITANDNKNSPGNLFLVKQPDSAGSHHMSTSSSHNKVHDDYSSNIDIEGILEIQGNQLVSGLNLIDLKLFQHYLKRVSKTIIASGICAASSSIWTEDIPDLAFEFPFLMHSILAFSATNLSRQQTGLDEVVATHRLECLKLLKDAVLEITPENTDALIASAIILIMDSLANAMPAQQGDFENQASNLSTSAWIFHVKGAATILTAVWPIPETSRFYNLINVDLTELSQYFINGGGSHLQEGEKHVTDLACFDDSIQDLYPVEHDSPYLITLAYLEKLNKGIDKDGFLLRIFSFPALLDKTFLFMLMTGDMNAMRIMRTYYKMLRSYVVEKKCNIWFLEGLTHVLPANVDEYSGGGVYMMLDFLGNGLPSMMGNVFGNEGASGLMGAFNFDNAFEGGEPEDVEDKHDLD